MNNQSPSQLDARLDQFAVALDDLTAAIGARDLGRMETALGAHDAALQALQQSAEGDIAAHRDRILDLRTRLDDAGRLARIAERLTARRLSVLVGERTTTSYTANGQAGGSAATQIELNA